jgi:ACS family hexuronate transporter-like MFS transporter
MFMRAILGIGEASMFPAAIKATAEWFPKKERSLCTGLFNSGTNVGAIIAPLIVTFVALQFGWRWAFVILGGITLIWLIFWQIYYDSPLKMLKKGKITQEEYDYIHADDVTDVAVEATAENKVAWHKILKHPQTWAFAIGKFLTDGIWWFFLFWLPLFLSEAHGQNPTQIAFYVAAVFTMATFGSIFGGYLPSRIMKSGKDPFKARMLAMFLIALFPLAVLGAQPLGAIHVLFPIILIGLGASAHQAWSANLFTTVSDMFPKKAVGSVVGFGGMMGATGSFLIHLVSGKLFDHHAALGQIEVGYGIMFIVCALAYLVAWTIMKVLVPRYKVIKEI